MRAFALEVPMWLWVWIIALSIVVIFIIGALINMYRHDRQALRRLKELDERTPWEQQTD